jgi:5-carboxyvanillate decarboxylase
MKRIAQQRCVVNCIQQRRGVFCRPVVNRMEISAPAPNKKAGYLRIAAEEAYAPPEMLQRYRQLIQNKECDDPGFLSQWEYFLGSAPQIQQLAARLQDIGPLRIQDMDATGISRQIVSLTSPGVQVFDAATGTSLATSFNDQLAEAIRRHPDRFSGLAAIAPQNPAGAAKELERGVTKLGLKGAIINSHTQGEYLDNQKFWEIFAAAESLNVPIYLHPTAPSAQMFAPFGEWGLGGAIYGFAVETSLHVLRIIMSGVFDRFPKLQMVIGHLGEGLPYWLFRIDFFQRGYQMNNRFPDHPKLKKKPSDYMKENIYVTTSGMAWQPPILFCQEVLGVDRVLYAMDYPYQFVPGDVKVTDDLPISDTDKKKLYQSNVEKVFNLKT